MSNIDYDTYYAKHCARYYGWLPASKAYRELIEKESLKYFTLCAKEAIDVFMLELEGVLLRDQNRKLPNVIICEKEPRDAAEIFKLVRPPLKEAILVGRLEEILTFQDTEETRGLSPDEDVRSRRLRKLLRIKDLAERIGRYFPFDIINFDPVGNLLNPDLEDNKLYQSLSRIFELQEPTTTFLLFITTPIFHIHPDSEARMRNNIESNVTAHPEIRTALLSSVGAIAYDDIDQNKRTALGFAKSVVIPVARSKGWECAHQGIYVYESPSRNRILNLVIRFSMPRTAPDESVHIEDIVRIIQEMPEYYSHEYSLENQEVREHLERVKEYREQVRNEYREEP